MDPSEVNIPPLKDLTIDNITENVHMINSQCDDPRMKYLLERLVSHVHDFARETRLSTNEWMAAIQFLTKVGLDGIRLNWSKVRKMKFDAKYFSVSRIARGLASL